ncbi:Omp28-related outer membrane protein [Flavobacterium sp. DG1-102-2]|uniref:Omp28-related outer membrane protein n=1 Tax=Flavobacterium sp. DG1-102-2 TaxID=3081663 RepID=UPI00294903CE|nr:Omp28-related outer membrane protein [Flavobacterium sp. DG1-102-2]MDV6169492.1 Omp28-related outer membrane protein [Flavobacterium sp. DG1-102-2]
MMKKNFILIFIVSLIFAGCSTDYEILKSQQNIILTADHSVQLIGGTITFTVKDKDGNDYTEDAVFAVDGQAIEGNTFSSATVGNFDVTATYNTVQSAPLVINFHDGSGVNFRKNMLIEDYTGTWCGYCPRVAWAIELVHNQAENAIAVGIHRSSSVPSSPNYDPYNFDASQLENALGAEGYPKGFLNRTIQWKSLEPDHVDQAIALTQGENPKLGLAMDAEVANGTINLDVNVMFGKDFTNNLKLVVYVLEDGLVYDQHNYTSYYDGVDILAGYTHNHVLRACLTPILGEEIGTTQTTIGTTYTKSFSVPVPANVTNAAKVNFVAFVVDQTGKVVNVRKVDQGEAQEMELL